MIRSHLTFANVVSVFALVVALSGSAYAVSQITGKDVKDSSLTGKDVKDRSLTGKDVKDSSLRADDFAPGQLPAGATGPKGDKGEPATRLWAVINADGTIGRSSGATAATFREDTGIYDVFFDRDVSSCAYLVSLGGSAAGTPPAGFAGATNLFGASHGLYVVTRNAAGTTVNQPFHIAVLC